MCEIVKRFKKPTNREVKAWKIISLSTNSENQYWSPIVFFKHRYGFGRWEKAYHPLYGFQAFTSKKAAKKEPLSFNHKLVKVRMRQIEGYGRYWPNGPRVVFAREVFVPKRKLSKNELL
jgi:hypothetical protein